MVGEYFEGVDRWDAVDVFTHRQDGAPQDAVTHATNTDVLELTNDTRR